MNDSPRAPGRFSLSRIGETPRQAGMLFTAQIGSTGVGFLSALIQTRFMEPDERGMYVFCVATLILLAPFFEFGLFSAGGRVLALAEDPENQRRALGALVILATGMGSAFSLFIWATAGPMDRVFHGNARLLLAGTALFGFFLPFQSLVEQSCIGLNRIRNLSESQLLTAASQLGLLGILLATGRLSARSLAGSYMIGVGIGSAYGIIRLGLSFQQTRQYLRMTFDEARRYGFNIYLARLTVTASGKLDTFIITYFLGYSGVGFYDTMQRLSNPIMNLARAAATTRFRAYARLGSVPQRMIKWNAWIVIGLAIVLATLGPLGVKIAFPKYAAASGLLLPFAVLNLFSGLFQPYNIFLSARGYGAELRNIAISVTVTGVALMLVCTPLLGMPGAAWAGAGAMALDFGLHLHYYRKRRGPQPEGTSGEPPPAALDERAAANLSAEDAGEIPAPFSGSEV